MGLPHMGVYSGGGVLFIGASRTPPMAPSGANSIWTLIPPPQGYNFRKSTTPEIWGVTFSKLNRRTPYSPFDLIHTNNALRTDGPIGGQKMVPQLILPEDM